jgi:hypothetical protein
MSYKITRIKFVYKVTHVTPSTISSARRQSAQCSRPQTNYPILGCSIAKRSCASWTAAAKPSCKSQSQTQTPHILAFSSPFPQSGILLKTCATSYTSTASSNAQYANNTTNPCRQHSRKTTPRLRETSYTSANRTRRHPKSAPAHAHKSRALARVHLGLHESDPELSGIP